MTPTLTANRRTYAGLFVVTLAMLMYEILLTRIFSVTMWYHFSFVAISVAMFGMTAGAILVYLFPRTFTEERVHFHLALCSLLFGVTAVLSFLTHLCAPPVYEPTILGLYSIALFYGLVSIPFVFCGVCVCLALTRFPKQVGRLYAADLVGAAAGCVLLIYVMKLTDGPTAVVVVALLAGVSSVLFGVGVGVRRLRRVATACCVLLGLFFVLNSVLARQQRPLIRLRYVKGRLERPPLYERWNSFSRIAVKGNPHELQTPFGWGLSPTCPRDRKVRQLMLDIDTCAATPMLGYGGTPEELEFLKYDVTNLAHWIRSDARVLVVGPGGGRDILSALAFGQPSVVGVEINEDILYTVNRKFGRFTGRLNRDPRVTFVNDEARSFVARQTDRFDVMQISMTDTWAATAAGAFVLTENSLYTVEAWKVFLTHLTPNGVLTVSRWHFAERPGEVLRLTSLASASLKSLGIARPRDHIVIVTNLHGYRAETVMESPEGIGTILLSRAPFSERDLDALEAVCERMRFEIVLSPRACVDPNAEALASGGNPAAVSEKLGLNLEAPTDDLPFFFHLLRLKDIFRAELWVQGNVTHNLHAVVVLGLLLVVVVVLTVLCLIVPLIARTGRGTLTGSSPLLIFFACIGLGFMLVEISQMQRLIVFLGHPTYGLSVVLFALLSSAGLGSFTTRKLARPGSGLWRLLVLLGLLCVFGIVTPHVVRWFQSAATPARIVVAVAVLVPVGFFMGMAFPMGMKLASVRSPLLTPWLWGVNGATSVCASVAAVAIALSWGISTSFWTGTACYLVACLAFAGASRRKGPAGDA